MSEIYLSGIDIKDFRTFGECHVELPATPGLLLLTGTNGLGKSSFLDAIEWALTGKIRRFTPYVSRSGKTVIPDADYLTRNGAERDSHAVTLQFSNGKPLRRSAGEEPTQAMISELLANPGRGAISDLSTHLAMTHFLGQAERQRFTSREASDQWAALKGPSGVDRLELIRTRLRGRSTTIAFNNRVKNERAAIADIEKDIADWQGWQDRLERLNAAVRAGGGLTEDDVRSRATEIEADVQRIAGLEPVDIPTESGGQLLARVSKLLETAMNSTSDRIKRLADSDTLISRYEAQLALASEDLPSLIRAGQQLEDVRSVNAARQQKLKVTREAVRQQSDKLASAQAEIDRLVAIRADLTRRAELKPQVEMAQSEVTAHKSALAQQQRILSEADEVVALHSATTKEQARLQGVAKQTRDALETSKRLSDLVAVAKERETVLSTALANESKLRSEHSETERVHAELSVRLSSTQAELAEAKLHASAITSAVASIASHIHDNEETCPVCNTEHPIGHLKLLATEAASSGDAHVTEVTKQAEQLRAELSAAAELIEANELVFAQTVEVEKLAKQARQAVADTTAILIEAIGGTESDDLARVAASRDLRAQTELRAILEVLASQQTKVDVAEELRKSSTAEISQLTARLDYSASRLSDLLTEDSDCSERMAARGGPTLTLEDIGTHLAKRRSELEVARTQLNEYEVTLAATTVEMKSIQEQLGTREAELAAAESAQKNAKVVVEELTTQWAKLALRGTPDRSTLEAAQGRHANVSTELDLISSRLKALSELNQDLLLEEEIANVAARMKAASGIDTLDNTATYLEALQAKIAPAQEALRLSQNALEAVSKYTEKLGERAEGYNREVLQPLNERVLEFNAAMLSTPGASVQFKASKRVDRTDLEMQLEYGDQIENSLLSGRKVPPQVVLSEGQLAANGFSILCAASTAYRWSSWPALLLDDPLQHNDIIHTAAFVDVMRNLVELESYQLIMSSHDRAESEFIARKFDAAGLACTTVVLTAPSDAGVVFDPPVYNSVARNSLYSHQTGIEESA